jgi:hypothetical protein
VCEIVCHGPLRAAQGACRAPDLEPLTPATYAPHQRCLPYRLGMTSPEKQLSDDHLARAVEVAAGLKPGTYDAVRALAAVSLAASAARIADALERQVAR